MIKCKKAEVKDMQKMEKRWPSGGMTRKQIRSWGNSEKEIINEIKVGMCVAGEDL